MEWHRTGGQLHRSAKFDCSPNGSSFRQNPDLTEIVTSMIKVVLSIRRPRTTTCVTEQTMQSLSIPPHLENAQTILETHVEAHPGPVGRKAHPISVAAGGCEFANLTAIWFSNK